MGNRGTWTRAALALGMGLVSGAAAATAARAETGDGVAFVAAKCPLSATACWSSGAAYLRCVDRESRRAVRLGLLDAATAEALVHDAESVAARHDAQDRARKAGPAPRWLCGAVAAAAPATVGPGGTSGHAASLPATRIAPPPDADGDGVANAGDLCPGTDAACAADADGCSPVQRVELACPPCAAPATGTCWKSHGAYVSCVAHAAKQLAEAGVLSQDGRGEVVSLAARSAVGFGGWCDVMCREDGGLGVLAPAFEGPACGAPPPPPEEPPLFVRGPAPAEVAAAAPRR